MTSLKLVMKNPSWKTIIRKKSAENTNIPKKKNRLNSNKLNKSKSFDPPHKSSGWAFAKKSVRENH